MRRYTSERCGDCGKDLTWIEIAFGRIFDPVCGACLIRRRAIVNPEASRGERDARRQA